MIDNVEWENLKSENNIGELGLVTVYYEPLTMNHQLWRKIAT
jgi:hypothetical protein